PAGEVRGPAGGMGVRALAERTDPCELPAGQLRPGRACGAFRLRGGRARGRPGRAGRSDTRPRTVSSVGARDLCGRVGVLPGRPGPDLRAPPAPVDHGVRPGAARHARVEAPLPGPCEGGAVAPRLRARSAGPLGVSGSGRGTPDADRGGVNTGPGGW